MAKLDKLLEQARAHLDAEEEVIAAVQGTYETKIMGNDSVRTGALIATSKRLVFFAKKVGGYDFESFPYSTISSFEQSKDLMGHRLSFFASGNKTEMKWINDAAKLSGLVTQVRSRMGKESQSTRLVPASSDDVVDQIRKLGELRDAGILTEEEFQSKKSDLLSRL